MDTSTAPTAINSRTATPPMPEKEAGAASRLSKTATLTTVSTHDSHNDLSPSTEKNVEIPTTTDVEESTILTGRKLFLVFVYVAYHLLISHISYLISHISYLISILLLLTSSIAVSSFPFSSSPSIKPLSPRPSHESHQTLMLLNS